MAEVTLFHKNGLLVYTISSHLMQASVAPPPLPPRIELERAEKASVSGSVVDHKIL